MTDFKQVFKQIFKTKWKWIKLIWLIQLIVVILGSLCLIIQHPHGVNYGVNSNYAGFTAQFFDFGKNIYAVPVNLSLWLIIWGDIVFLGILIWQAYKINLSSTWRLIAIDDGKLWQANLWSSFVSCVVILILQATVAFILMLVEETFSRAKPITNTFVGINKNPLQGILGTISFCLVITGIVFLILTLSDFAIFSSRTITDFLPIKNIKVVRAIVMIAIIILAIYFGSHLTDALTAFTNKQTDRLILNTAARTIREGNDRIYWAYNLTEWATAAEFLISALILGCLNNWLIKKFVEPKNNNY